MASSLPLVIQSGSTKQLQSGDVLLLQSGGLDLAAAGALILAPSGGTATSVELGSASIHTTVKGNLTVDGNELVSGTTQFVGDTIQFGDARTDIVTMQAAWDASTYDFEFKKEANHRMDVGDSTTAATAGGNLTIAAGLGNGAAGGNLELDAGDGTEEGIVKIGAAHTSAIELGNSAETSTTDFKGTGAITATGNPTWNFGTGQADFGGNLDANAGLDVSGANLTVAAAVDLAVGADWLVDGTTGDLTTNGVIKSLTDGEAVVIGHEGTGSGTGSCLVVAPLDPAYIDYATNGMINYDSQGDVFRFYADGGWQEYMSKSSTGTTGNDWHVNTDNSTTDYDTQLVLYAGDGTSQFIGHWKLNCTADPPTLEYYVTDDAALDSAIISVGKSDASAETGNLTAQIRLTGTDGSGNATYASIFYAGGTDVLTVGTGATSVSVPVNLDASGGVDITGGALTIANQAITQTTGGQVTFAGNVDANAGLDVTGTLTVGGAAIATSTSSLVLGTGTAYAPQMAQLTTAQRDALTATNGMIIYNTSTSQMQMYSNSTWGAIGVSGSPGSGTPELSWTVNNDADTTDTASTVYMSVWGGDGTNLIKGYWTLNCDTVGDPILEYSVTTAGSADDAKVAIGTTGQDSSGIDAYLYFNSGSGVAEQTSIWFDGVNDDLVIGTGATSVSSAVNFDAEAGLDVTGAALTASAALTVTGGALTFSGTNIDLDPTGTFDLEMNASQAINISMADAYATAFTLDDTGGASWITVNTSTNTMTLGGASLMVDASDGQLDVPDGTDFYINGTALTTANFTATNIDTLLNGSNADALHTHASSATTVAVDTTTNVLLDGDLGYLDAANRLDQAIATAISTAWVFGVAEDASEDEATIVGVIAAANIEASITIAALDRLYLSKTTAGTVTNVAPSSAGDVVAEVGIAMAAGTGAGGTVKMLFRPYRPIEL